MQVRFRITDARVSQSRPETGILVIAIQLINQRGEVVKDGDHRLMVRRKPVLVDKLRVQATSA